MPIVALAVMYGVAAMRLSTFERDTAAVHAAVALSVCSGLGALPLLHELGALLCVGHRYLLLRGVVATVPLPGFWLD